MLNKTMSFLAAMLLLVACSESTAEQAVAPTEDTYTVALVLPFGSSGEFDINSTLQMFEKNLQEAQLNCSHRVKLNFEKYDEDTQDLSQLASDLRHRDDVKAIIGPVDQNHLRTMSYQLRNSTTPLMAINAGSTDVVRGSVEQGDYFWALTQTDISKLEIMLSSAAKTGVRRFDLVCSSTGYISQTYKDWFGFEVSELGLTVSGNHLYTNSSQISSMLQESFSDDDLSDKCIICVPDNAEEAHLMFEELETQMEQLEDDNRPKLFFSDNIMQMDLLSHEFLEEIPFYTVTPTCSPESGFYPGFQSGSGQTLSLWSVESQFYDALMLTSMALALNPDSLISSLRQITGNEAQEQLIAWTPENMSQIFQQIGQGSTPACHIAGASGPLCFDEDNHTCVTESYFMLSYYEDPVFEPIAFYGADKNGSSESSLADWKWQQSRVQDFSGITYKPGNTIPLDKRWAVIVAASKGFENYRHQADALNVYQYLRTIGYDDDHILLVMEDDIAGNSQNPRPGEVLAPDGSNLYYDVHVDYKVSELTPEQMLDKIAQLPCDADDNVMVFWSGHGTPGALTWADDQHITPSMVSDAQDCLTGRYRKMAWFIEACYSGCIGEALQGGASPESHQRDYLMALTATNANEPSKSYLLNPDIGMDISNRFSAYLLSSVKSNPGISIKDLYNYLCLKTIGSHVMLYNPASYGDITQEEASEYFGIR